MSLAKRLRGELSSIEIKVLVDEIAEKLRACRVANIYRMPDASYVIRLSSEEGRRDLRIAPNKCIYLVEGVYEERGELDAFAKALRQYLRGMHVKSLEAVSGERIVKLVFGLREPLFSLVAELFPGGRLVLVDVSGVVRASHPPGLLSKEYTPPAARTTVLEREEALKIIRELDGNVRIGVTLARNLGLGPKYSEEVLARAGVDPSVALSALTEAMLGRVLDALESLKLDLSRPSPRLYVDEEVVVPAPFALRSLEHFGLKSEPVDSFNEAVRRFYESQPPRVLEDVEMEAERLEKELLEKRRLLAQLEGEAEKKRRLAELIFTNLGVAEEARLDMLAGLSRSDVVSVNWNEGTFTLKIGDEQVKLLIREPVSRQVSSLFNDAKMTLRGVENIRAEIEEIEKKLEETRALRKPATTTPIVRRLLKREWFENYRWSYTSGGRLIVAGRDASTNIKLLKRHLESKDVVFHADVRGSPVAILKDGSEAAQEELEEAATFCGAYSRAWREGLSAISVYMVRPDQVSFSPPPGTFLPRGSFIVKPPKTYFQVELKLCIGLREEPRRVVAGHERWVSSIARVYVCLVPGERTSEELAKIFSGVVKEKVGIELSREEVEEFKAMVPYGKARIAR